MFKEWREKVLLEKVENNAFLQMQCHLNGFLLQLERQNGVAAQTLRKALSNAELNHPGITYDLVLGLVRRADLNLDMNESVLRLQGVASDCDGNLLINFHLLT